MRSDGAYTRAPKVASITVSSREARTARTPEIRNDRSEPFWPPMPDRAAPEIRKQPTRPRPGQHLYALYHSTLSFTLLEISIEEDCKATTG